MSCSNAFQHRSYAVREVALSSTVCIKEESEGGATSIDQKILK